MRQDVVDNGGFIPLDIKAVADGTVLKPKEPAMVVSGPAELAATYEPIFLRAFFKSIVATDAHYLEEIIGQGRVAEFGKRATANEDFHLDLLFFNRAIKRLIAIELKLEKFSASHKGQMELYLR